ncbi:MAG: DNA repair protein RadC [Desulfobacteraceae bacterium]|nr:DNA repair protein RadC [Desulfobacteraceae bacterium]
MKRISQLTENERPREKLLVHGAKSLSDVELLAILLNSGNKSADVMTLAGRLLKAVDHAGTEVKIDTLTGIDGIGPAKAATITAALEFARRRIRPEGMKIKMPTDVLPLIQHLNDRKQEHFICVSLNGANEVNAVRTVSVGLVNKTQVHPREVFADPITDRATAVIVAHNHPSGSLAPSDDDVAVTRRLTAAGETLGIAVLDHIIFNRRGYYSFSESNRLS